MFRCRNSYRKNCYLRKESIVFNSFNFLIFFNFYALAKLELFIINYSLFIIYREGG